MWSPSELEDLSGACDALLREDVNDVGRMAVPLLHFRSAHPSALEVYRPLKEAGDLGLGWRDRLLGLRDQWWPNSGADLALADGPVDTLFVSHVTSVPQARGQRQDPYFGDLPEQLVKAGRRCAIAYIDQTSHGIALEDWAARRDDDDIARILLARRLDHTSERRIARALESSASRLERGSDHLKLRALAARQARTGAARQGLRIADQVGRLVSRLQPRALVFTYEGHAWERLVMAAARQHAPNTRCLAVHHAILAPLQHAMVRRYGPALDPDGILVAGRIAFRWLRGVPALHDRPMAILGSPKVLTPEATAARPEPGRTCLFLPEGFLDESLLLARAAVGLAETSPETTVVIRLHPLVTQRDLIAATGELRSTPANLVWSPPERRLDEDTAAARWAVYRGSSAILSALAQGVEPIYFGAEPAELRIDPLRGGEAFRRVAATVPDLVAALSGLTLDPERKAAATAYASDYYAPLDAQALLGLLDETRPFSPTRSNEHE